VVDFRDPVSQARRQFFFEKRKDAEAKRAEMIVEMATGRYASPTTAMQSWLEDRKLKVKGVTFTTAHVHESGQRFHESGHRGGVTTGGAFGAFLQAVPRDGLQDQRLTVAAF
jgi:hypothetical protein